VNGWKRIFGVDLFDTFVHVVVTAAILALLAHESQQVEPVLLTACGSLILYSVRRHIALRRQRTLPDVSGETTTGVHRRLDAEDRLQELEGLYGRMADLEERVDFAERLLAQKGEPMKLESPKA
jgi:hypothetical protein